MNLKLIWRVKKIQERQLNIKEKNKAGGLMLPKFSSVQFTRSVMSDSLWPHGLQHPRLPCPSHLPEFAQTHPMISSSVVPFSFCLQSFPASGSFLMSQFFALVAKVLEFQLQHQSFNEYSGLISFRIDWLDLLALQGALKSLLQHHSSKASVIWLSAFFMIQFSHPYMTTGKTIALTV